MNTSNPIRRGNRLVGRTLSAVRGTDRPLGAEHPSLRELALGHSVTDEFLSAWEALRRANGAQIFLLAEMGPLLKALCDCRVPALVIYSPKLSLALIAPIWSWNRVFSDGVLLKTGVVTQTPADRRLLKQILNSSDAVVYYYGFFEPSDLIIFRRFIAEEKVILADGRFLIDTSKHGVAIAPIGVGLIEPENLDSDSISVDPNEAENE
jgi:hypothetical protein